MANFVSGMGKYLFPRELRPSGAIKRWDDLQHTHNTEPLLFSLLCFLTAWQLWRVASGTTDRLELALWRGLAIALVVLAINDLFEGAITDVLRSRAMQQGWYEGRQIIQIGFIIVAGLTCLLASCVLLRLAWRAPFATKVVVVALALLVALALIRGASLHETDHLLDKRMLGLKLNRIIEIGGLALVLLASEWRRWLLHAPRGG